MDLEELSGSQSLSPTILRLTLIVLLLLLSHQPAEGQLRVIGSLQPVVAAPGDEVILPCHVEPQIDLARLTIEWSRPDIKPDPNDRLRRVHYVHLYRNTREDLDMKIPSYARRTTLSADGLRHGNISLKITNVTLADEGPYKCFIPKLKSSMQHSVVHLVIVSNNNKTSTTETPRYQTPGPTEESIVKGPWFIAGVTICLLTLLVGVTVGLFVRQKCKKRDHKKVPVI